MKCGDLGKKCIFAVDITENLYSGFVHDDTVAYNYKEYSGNWDKMASDCDLPDKFVYETVKGYLWNYKYILASVSIIIN